MNNDELAFDRKHAMEITDGDMEFLKELLEIFKIDCLERLTGISLAIKEKDFKTLDKTAHSLKGSSGNLGLTRIYELYCKLEMMGKEENIKRADETLNELKEEFERLNAFISMSGWEEK